MRELAKLEVLLGKLDDYADILGNRNDTPNRRQIAAAQAVQKKINKELEILESNKTLSAELIREIRERVDDIVKGSRNADIILDALKRKLVGSEMLKAAGIKKGAGIRKAA